MRRRVIALLVTGVIGMVLAGCGSSGHSAAKHISQARPVSVPLTIYRSHGLVTAFVRVTLDGHPYYFIVDTGAGRTFIDAQVARTLGLRDDGSPRTFWTVGCVISGQPVALPSWRVGGAPFPATTVFAQRLLIAQAFPRFRPAGLLGSDLLSRFGAATIDVIHRQLILGGATKAGTGGRAVPVKILRLNGGVLATTQVELDHRRAGFLVDTGAALSFIDWAAAARLRLKAAGPTRSASGAACRSPAAPVLVHGWSFATLHLAQAIIGRANRLLPEQVLHEGIVGIVGMATLARFGTLTIDYSHSRLILGGSEPSRRPG